MKKTLTLVLASLIFSTAVLAVGELDLRQLMPPYWIVGRVEDNAAAGALAEGRYVDFYLNDEDLAAGRYAQGIVSGNQFMLNGFQIWPQTLVVGATYLVATERRADNFGASGRVTISGNGWDQVAMGGLIDGGGVAQPAAGPGSTQVIREQAPKIKAWFGNRLYQPAIIAAGEAFIIASNPKIRAEISIEPPDSVSGRISDYSIQVDPGTANSRTLALTASNMTAQSYAAAGEMKAFTLSYDINESDKLSDGPHVFNFNARSSGARGVAATVAETATVEVAGGPLRVIGTPLTFPSPFRIHQDRNITIQYILSQNADVDLTIYSVEGRIVKKFYCSRGTEGGSAGTNKVTWDGMRDDGMRAGAGVYVGSIVGREENRLLAKFKVAIVE